MYETLRIISVRIIIIKIFIPSTFVIPLVNGAQILNAI